MERDPFKRFLSKLVVNGGCLEWTGTKNYGYGYYLVKGKNHRAHRYAYERLVGPIPEGLTLDHLCRNRACVNPKHLEPVTIQENLSRARASRANKG